MSTVASQEKPWPINVAVKVLNAKDDQIDEQEHKIRKNYVFKRSKNQLLFSRIINIIDLVTI